MTESNRIEYKRELSESLEREVVAFLNAREGGILYIGIDDEENILGVLDCDQAQLVIKDRLKNNIRPSIMGLFEIIHERRNDKDIIRMVIAGGLEKPYYLKKYGMTEKGCFLRVGSAAEPIPQDMIDSLYSRRVRNTIGRMESTQSPTQSPTQSSAYLTPCSMMPFRLENCEKKWRFPTVILSGKTTCVLLWRLALSNGPFPPNPTAACRNIGLRPKDTRC
jgi:hypothetical protein